MNMADESASWRATRTRRQAGNGLTTWLRQKEVQALSREARESRATDAEDDGSSCRSNTDVGTQAEVRLEVSGQPMVTRVAPGSLKRRLIA